MRGTIKKGFRWRSSLERQWWQHVSLAKFGIAQNFDERRYMKWR